MLLATALGFVLAGPSLGQDQLSGSEFEAIASGQTLHFSLDGAPYGAEMYFSGRRSLWRTPDGSCAAGVWREEAGDICFYYEEERTPQCWRFERSGERLTARFVEDGAPNPDAVVVDRIDVAQLDCPGVNTGV